MKTFTTNGIKVTAYMVENPNFIQKGEYKRTELDNHKESVDFLITFCGDSRYEIVFNHPVELKPSRSINSEGNNRYYVTEKALDNLKEKFTWATDF